MSILIKVTNLTKHFKPSAIWALTGMKSVKAVEKVSFQIEEGSVYGLVGESGCGKTTIGRLILRLIEPDDGEILFDGKDILTLSKSDLKDYRRKAQIIFQNPFSSLNPRRSIMDILSTGYEVYDIGNKAERRQWLEELMTQVGLEPEHLARYPHQFSGGQRQRLVVARALSLHPKFIVADEPVSALDVSIQAQILNLLRKLQLNMKFTMLFISHDLRVISHMSDQIGVMYLGRLVETARKKDLFNNPLHPYTQALMISAPTMDDSKKVKGEIIQGEVWDIAPPKNGCIFYHRCSEALPDCKDLPQELVEKSDGHAVACWRV
jgi:oligopeptide/dipeptide ABC transporter ATP-binding protein